MVEKFDKALLCQRNHNRIQRSIAIKNCWLRFRYHPDRLKAAIASTLETAKHTTLGMGAYRSD